MKRESGTINDIALLFECIQIVDIDTKKRHPTKVAINNLTEVKLHDELIHHGRMGEYLTRRGDISGLN